MKFEIYNIVNNPISSNCYIIFSDNKECIIVDPGSEKSSEIIKFINKYDLKPVYFIITHEHFDHIWCLNELRTIFKNSQLISSSICSEHIQNMKQNFSFFYDGRGFEISKSDIIINGLIETIIWNDSEIQFIQTPGHSKGSMCIFFEKLNILFTGDTIIYGEKIVTKLKGGDIFELNKSMDSLKSLYFTKNPLLMPGHGIPISYNEYLESVTK